VTARFKDLTTDDRFIGYYVDGVTSAGTGISPNASNYYTSAFVDATGFAGNSTGFYVNGRFSDQYFNGAETAGAWTGMHVKGDPADSTHSQIDVHMRGPVFDA
jgi:hypothetical protein